MKAKKQKLLFKAIKWIGEQCEMGWNKEEIQDLLDEFIDHHDSKKKSKFKVGDVVVIDDGSMYQNCIAEIITHDKEDKKLPYQLIILQSENKDSEGADYWMGREMRKTNLEKSKFGSDNEQVKLKEEPIQYPSFKVGDSARKYLELCKEFENKALKLIKND